LIRLKRLLQTKILTKAFAKTIAINSGYGTDFSLQA